MEMPIDVKELLGVFGDVDKARQVPLSITLLIDESADDDLVALVRNGFVTAKGKVHLVMNYFQDAVVAVGEGDDLTAIVAGASPVVGEQAEAARAAGSPAMVVTIDPEGVAARAEAAGHPIPEADLVAPREEASGVLFTVMRQMGAVVGGRAANARNADRNEVASSAQRGADAASNLVARRQGFEEGTQAEDGTYVLDERGKQLLENRMGEWVVAACAEKRLALALALPFARRPMAVESMQATAFQNAVVGAAVFIPGADMPVMLLNQAKMLLQIAAAYGQEIGVGRIKELAAMVGGGMLLRQLARRIVTVIPGAGLVVKVAIGYTGTLAMGHALIDYFEKGGDIAGAANVAVGARDAAVRAATAVADSPFGKATAQAVQQAAGAVLAKQKA